MASVIPIDRLTLKDMMTDFDYSGLAEGLKEMPVPEYFTLGLKRLYVPRNLDEFLSTLVYGQRIFFNTEEENDFGVIIRVIDGYYYPQYSGKKWDADAALLIGKKVIHCAAKTIYPVAMHLVNLISEMADREKMLLHREPSKAELAAGIEKLNIFSELTALDFLRDAMKITVEEVLQTPYKECLVRFMLAKEVEDYKERYLEMLDVEAKQKMKKK